MLTENGPMAETGLLFQRFAESLTAALYEKANLQLELPKRSAKYPKRTFKLNPKCCRISANLSGESSD